MYDPRDYDGETLECERREELDYERERRESELLDESVDACTDDDPDYSDNPRIERANREARVRAEKEEAAERRFSLYGD